MTTFDLQQRLARLRELPEPRADVLVDGQMPDLYARKVYAIMGATVTDRGPHISETAGINVAILECPPGKGVGLHNHATAEVLMPISGTWRFDWGAGSEVGVHLGPCDVFSVPVGVNRRFTNRSAQPALMFAVVQGDGVANTVKLAASVIEEGRARGLEVDDDGRLIGGGLSFPPRELHIPELEFSRPEVLARIAHFHDLDARPREDGGEELMALSSAPGSAAAVHDAVGFSLSFLRLEAGGQTAVGAADVHLLMPLDGQWRLEVGGQTFELRATDVFAIPAGMHGTLSALGSEAALCLSLVGDGSRVGVEANSP
ncbi:hypothetical protein [Deinococcus frigens]|uniref:hypothetical protein n=1 Tax=Deinococcus frigens TaxID=249403 RepID=UPI000496D037|nr:hypothetical protein [Deinococcus frigens]